VLSCMLLAWCTGLCAAAGRVPGWWRAGGLLTLTMLEKAFSKPLQSSKTSRRPVGASPSVLTAFSTTILRSVRRSMTCARQQHTQAACCLWMLPAHAAGLAV
jgi:hypothetical protein